nr:MerC domain-containing protein [Polymorphobacter sp.]
MYRNIMPQRFSSFLDKSAMTLSGLCLVHCLAGTLLLTVFAASGDWLGHNVHFIGLLIAMPLAIIALWRGIAIHGRIGVGLLGALGIILMAASLFIAHGDAGELLLSVLGVSLLGLAHLWNLRAAR